MNRKTLIGNSLLLLTAMIWGTAFVFQRQGMDSIEPISFNAARMWLGAVIIGALSLALRKRDLNIHNERSAEEQRSRDKSTLAGGLLCGLFISVASIAQQIGLVYTSAGKAGFITAMYMVLVPVFNLVLFRKSARPAVWAAVVIGVAGLYLLCATGGFNLSKGDTLVCICAVLFASHILCADRYVPTGDPVAISAIQFAVASVVCTIAAFIFEEPSWAKIASAAIPILFCGILSTCVGYTLQIVAQKMTDPTVASLILSLESVFAAISGALILGERMTPRETAGCVIMFAAIILVQIPLPHKKHY